MSLEVYMPKFGMTMKEGKIVNWFKKEGDDVEKGEPILEVETEKIVNTVDAQVSGKLEKILYPEGETVSIGIVIAYIDVQLSESIPAIQKEEKSDTDLIAEDPVKIIREIKPLSGLRKIIGERMAESLRRSPQGTMTTRADMTELIALKDYYKSQGHKVTFTDMFVKIVALAFQSNPIINSAIEDGKLVIYQSANIGVAVGTEGGLLVPVIKNAEKKSILEISREVKEMSKKIKENHIKTEDMTGGTFTISNLGMFDVDIITPIINPPEAAILAIGTTHKEVVVLEDGATCVKPLTTLSLTADHAIMDGLPAVKFLASIKEIMKNPREYLG